MKASTKSGILCMALAFAAALFPCNAKADTYNIFVLDSDEGRTFRGMDASGTVILANDAFLQTTCDSYNPGCFSTYTNGHLISVADTLPVITPDNGTPCTPTVPPGGTVRMGVCNSGYDAFMGYMTPGQIKPGLYTGSGQLLWGEGTGGFLYMNSGGDIVWNDPNREFWYEAINTTSQVPEPATLTLLATGALAALGAARRRYL